MELLVQGFVFTFLGCFFLLPMLFGIARLFGLYTIVEEGQCQVYLMFGQVLGVLKEPGLYFLPRHLGLKAFFIHFLGSCSRVDTRLDQEYLRSQPVNSEEGAPMGIGIWYEMIITNPVAWLFKNADPRTSLSTNVRSAAVRCLSNMKLNDMLEDRHTMSHKVREEVTPQASEWGYQAGSVYIRKVHFRDSKMIAQIQEKVVNRLRQVTSAIKQDGVNQVSIITSTAENSAAAEFAKAAAVRPKIVGEALQEISKDPEISAALFEILEAQKLAEGNASITMIPPGKQLLGELMALGTEESGHQGDLNRVSNYLSEDKSRAETKTEKRKK